MWQTQEELEFHSSVPVCSGQARLPGVKSKFSMWPLPEPLHLRFQPRSLGDDLALPDHPQPIGPQADRRNFLAVRPRALKVRDAAKVPLNWGFPKKMCLLCISRFLTEISSAMLATALVPILFPGGNSWLPHSSS